MYCSKCGTENPEDGNLCNNCGNKLSNLEPKIASTIVKNKNQGMIKYSKCNSEITTLRKHLPFWEIILWVILLFIPIIGWILLVIEVAWYFSRNGGIHEKPTVAIRLVLWSCTRQEPL